MWPHEKQHDICLFFWTTLVISIAKMLIKEGSGTPLLPGKFHGQRAWWAAVHGVNKSQIRLSNFTFTFHFHALEKEMATHSSVLAWRIPGTGEPGGLPSMGSHRVGHDQSDLAAAGARCLYVPPGDKLVREDYELKENAFKDEVMRAE